MQQRVRHVEAAAALPPARRAGPHLAGGRSDAAAEEGRHVRAGRLGEQFTKGAEQDDLDFFPFPEVDSRIGTGAIEAPIDGPEVGVPRPQFERHFDAARAAGLRSLPHAGETTGPQTIWDALTVLKAERIGHGTSAAQDPALLAHLAEHRIPLEVCPSSNVATGAVATLEEHPLKTFVDAGVPVTINSDDPPMFATTLNQEYEIAADLLSLDNAGIADLARAAVDVSYAPDDLKARLRAEIDTYATS